MTTYTGTFEYAGGNGMQVILDVTWSAVTSTSTNVIATVVISTVNQYTYSDTQTLTWGGSESPATLPDVPAGSASFTNSQGTAKTTRRTNTYTYPYTTYGTSPGTVTFTAAVSGTYNGVTPSVSGTIAIPARPGGIASVWNGSAWVDGTPKVWNGSAWVTGQARIWDGTQWKYGI